MVPDRDDYSLSSSVSSFPDYGFESPLLSLLILGFSPKDLFANYPLDWIWRIRANLGGIDF